MDGKERSQGVNLHGVASVGQFNLCTFELLATVPTRWLVGSVQKLLEHDLTVAERATNPGPACIIDWNF